MTSLALADDFNPEVLPRPLSESQGAVKLLLELEAAGAVTRTSLQLPADISYESYEALGAFLGAINRSCAWLVGDWLLFGEGAFGERFAQAADATGLAESTLSNRMTICKSIPPSRRREHVPFSVHAVVAHVPAKEQRHWLAEAEANQWTVAELRTAMKPDRPERQDTLREAALAVLRDAYSAADGLEWVIPSETFTRLRDAVGGE